MLDNFVLSIVSWWDIMNRSTWCTVVHRHVLRFLFVRGVATILKVGGLYLEDQQNGLIVISLVDLDLEHLMSRNSKFETFLPLFLLTSSVECVQNP
jgi:hypothetical protein